MTDEQRTENQSLETSGQKTPIRRGQFLTPFDEFDQWFDELRHNWLQPFALSRGWPEQGGLLAGRNPRVDIIDRDAEYCVKAELPGVSKENLDISLDENLLTIRATTQSEEKEEKGQYFRRETSRGEYQRTIRLPGAVDSENAKANFKDGILELSLPKIGGAQRRSIRVE